MATTFGTTRLLIRRSEAARIAGWSVPTLSRRERSDPGIPQRIATGPGGGPPYGYRLDEWSEYVARLPRATPPAPPTPEASIRAADIARDGVAKRKAKRSVADTAEGQGFEPSRCSSRDSQPYPIDATYDAPHA